MLWVVRFLQYRSAEWSDRTLPARDPRGFIRRTRGAAVGNRHEKRLWRLTRSTRSLPMNDDINVAGASADFHGDPFRCQ